MEQQPAKKLKLSNRKKGKDGCSCFLFMKRWLHGCCCCSHAALHYERFSIKHLFKQMFKAPTKLRKALRKVIMDATDRYNEITFNGMGLAAFHILRQFDEHGEKAFQADQGGKVYLLSGTFIRHCFHAVSRLNPGDDEPTSMERKDPALHESAKLYRAEFPKDHVFPHRKGLRTALEYAIIDEMANIQNHVKVHLHTRIKRWLVV